MLTIDGICYYYNQVFLNYFLFVRSNTLGQNFNLMINNDLKKEKNEEKQGGRRYLEGESTGMMGGKLINASG